MNANAPPKRIGVLLQTPINKNLRSTQSNSGVAISQACKHGTTRVELMPQGHTHHAREVCATCRRHVRWLPKLGTVERQRLNAFRLARLAMCEGLNPWERNFLRSVSQRRKVSSKQQQIIDRLCADHLKRDLAS